MEEEKSNFMKNNKKRIICLITVLGSIIFVYLLLILILLLGTVGNPVVGNGEKDLDYLFGYYEDGARIPKNSEFCIPAIVNENGDPVFSENELNELVSPCQHTEQSYRGPYRINYVETPYGTMISVRPLENEEFQDICVRFKKENYRGDSYTFSPVFSTESTILSRVDLIPKSYALPVYSTSLIFPP